MSLQIKLARPGQETRRLVLSDLPSWAALRSRVSSLFDIPSASIALSYEDSDGDVVTFSSQDELNDYLANFQPDKGPVKFSVLDLREVRQSSRKRDSVVVEDAHDVPGLPTMGQTIVFDVEDTDWQDLSRAPNIFSLHDVAQTPRRSAFVEVVDSNVSSKKSSVSSRSASPNPLKLQAKAKGKNRGPPAHGLKSAFPVSTASADTFSDPSTIRDPLKSGETVPRGGRSHIQGRNEPLNSRDTLNNFTDRYKSGYQQEPSMDPTQAMHSESQLHAPYVQTSARVLSPQTNPRNVRSSVYLDIESHSVTPAPHSHSFVRDISRFLDNLTNAFASHPELSEGLQNIVRNILGGAYWGSERERFSNAAEAFRRVAEETSQRINHTVSPREQDAVRSIAEALGGVFRVLGEISSAGDNSTSRARQQTYENPNPHGHERSFQSPQHASPPLPQVRPPTPPLVSERDGRGQYQFEHRHYRHYYHQHHHGSGAAHAYDTDAENRQVCHRDVRRTDCNSGQASRHPHIVPLSRTSAHESKAQLEAAKALYKAEKERFRREKEERRALRRLIERRRSGESSADRLERQEKIVARIPLPSPSRHPYAEVYTIPTSPAHPSPRMARAGSVEQTSNVPMPAPPLPNVADTQLQSGSTIPPSTLLATQVPASVPLRPVNVPMPWPPPPPPPPRDTRRGLAKMKDRILARLHDMGIFAASQSDLIDILHLHAKEDGANEDEVLRTVIEALNIRGSASPHAFPRPSDPRRL